MSFTLNGHKLDTHVVDWVLKVVYGCPFTRGRPNSKANALTRSDPSAFVIVLSRKESCSPIVAFVRLIVQVNGNKQPKQKVLF